MVLSVDFSKCAATLDLNNLEVHTYDDQTKCRLDKDYLSESKKQEAHGPHRSAEKSSKQLAHLRKLSLNHNIEQEKKSNHILLLENYMVPY